MSPPLTRSGAKRSPLFAIAAHRELVVLFVLAIAITYFVIAAGKNGFASREGIGTYLVIAAQIGIVGSALTLLMTAGEFDLSIGSLIGLSEMLFAFAVVKLQWPLLPSLGLTLIVAVIVGVINARIIVKTGLPSFLVTLAGLFVLLGLAEGGGILLTGSTMIGHLREATKADPLVPLFSGYLWQTIPVSVVWWLAATAISAWVLHQTQFGNWIHATGGNLNSAVKSGVPVLRVKTYLYIATACMSVVVAWLNVFAVNQSSADDGQNMVFQVVTATVIGGTLITGGRGSAIGTAIAALLFGVMSQGFFFTDIAQQWYNLFVGAVLMFAILIDKYTGEAVERQSAKARRA